MKSGLYFMISIFAIQLVSMLAGTCFAQATEPPPALNMGTDRYVSGQKVVIDERIQGDLIVVGKSIMVRDTVDADLVFAGGDIDLRGAVLDDVRGAGLAVRVNGTVDGDLVAAGGRIVIDSGAIVAGNLLTFGETVEVKGRILGSMRNSSSVLKFSGECGGTLETESEAAYLNGVVNGRSSVSAGVINVGKNAQFNNDVRYWTASYPANFGTSLKAGDVFFDRTLARDSPKWQYLGFSTPLIFLLFSLSGLLMTMLVQYALGKLLQKAADVVKMTPGRSLLTGMLFMIGVPVTVVLLISTVIALPIAFVLASFFVSVLIFALVTLALIIAHWINNTFYLRCWRDVKLVTWAWLIFLGLKLFMLTPTIGPLLVAAMVLMSTGAILRSLKMRRHKVARAEHPAGSGVPA